MPYIDGRMILVEIKTYEYIKEIFISNYYRMAKYTPLKNKPTRAGELFLILFLNDIDTWTIDFSWDDYGGTIWDLWIFWIP